MLPRNALLEFGLLNQGVTDLVVAGFQGMRSLVAQVELRYRTEDNTVKETRQAARLALLYASDLSLMQLRPFPILDVSSSQMHQRSARTNFIKGENKPT